MIAPSVEHDAGALSPVRSWLDDRFGPITQLGGVRQGGGQPPWWIYHASLTRPLGMHFTEQDHDAWGTSIDGGEALAKCLGEVLERYCLHNSAESASLQVLPARECKVYSELPVCAPYEKCNRGFKGIEPDWLLTQAPVVEVASGQTHWLPAAYVCFGFHGPEGEMRVTLSITTGAAFHETLPAAIWSGLCEVAERDAIALFWHNQVAPPEITIDRSRCAYKLAERLDRFEAAGLEARFFDISTEFKVPTVFCIASGPRYPYRTVSAACSSDAVHAMSKCLDEIILVRSAQITGKLSLNVQSLSEFEWVRSLRDHSDVYAVWRDTPAFDFMLRPDREKIGFEEFVSGEYWTRPAGIDELRQRCQLIKEELGMDVFYADVTMDDAREFGSCAKVVVPQMVPISVPESAKWLATPRLVAHAEKHGTKPGMNPFPHPFP